MTRCLDNPAQRDNAQGKYPEAEPLVKRALAIRASDAEQTPVE